MKRLNFAVLALLLGAGCGSETTPQSVTDQPAATSTPVAQQAEEAPKQPLDELLKQADEQLAARDANAAVKTLSIAIAQYPKAVQPYLNRGTLLGEAKMLPEAIRDMNVAIELEPKNARLRNTRGYFLLLMKDLDRAYQDFSDAVGLDLKYPQPYNNRGLVMIAKEDYAAAVKEFDAALRVDEKYVDALNNRGYALMQLERMDESIAAFDLVLELNPNYLNSLNNRGRAFHKLERFDDAVTDFAKAIELAPGNLQYYALRGESLRAGGRMIEARADMLHINRVNELKQVNSRLKANPSQAELWVRRGELLMDEAEFDEAEKSFVNATRVDAKCVEAMLGHARLSTMQGNWDKVVEQCNAALALGTSHAALSLRGDAYYAQEKLDEALGDYQTARRMDAHVAAAFLKRSELLKKEGKADESKADYIRAVSFDPSLGDGEIVPASAEMPAREPARFPTADELSELRKTADASELKKDVSELKEVPATEAVPAAEAAPETETAKDAESAKEPEPAADETTEK